MGQVCYHAPLLMSSFLGFKSELYIIYSVCHIFPGPQINLEPWSYTAINPLLSDFYTTGFFPVPSIVHHHKLVY